MASYRLRQHAGPQMAQVLCPLLLGLIWCLGASVEVLAQGGSDVSARSLLKSARSWTYQLQRLDDPRLLETPSDLLVIDYSFDGSEPRELWPAQVERFKMKPGGGRRLVLAYLSVGEAEDYRFYWEAAWDVRRPDWFLPETCRWQGNHVVHFWRDDWKRLIYRGGSPDYLTRIQRAGFDGVYLDRIDAYAQVSSIRPTAMRDMVSLVRELSETARARQRDFLVIAQNAEELLVDATYRRAVDAVAKEDLLYGLSGDGARNPVSEAKSSVGYLMRLRRDGKPVLTVEYLRDEATVARVRREHLALGFVPTFTGRALQGVADSTGSKAQLPSPELAAANPCR